MFEYDMDLWKLRPNAVVSKLTIWCTVLQLVRKMQFG